MKQLKDASAAATEQLLLDHTHRLARIQTGRRAIIIHLSRLRADNRRTHHVRIAVNTFETLVRRFEGQIFVLHNADIVFICKNASITVIDEAVQKLRYLFGDDPLAAELEEHDADPFATWYDLECDYDAFRAVVEQRHEEAARRGKRLPGAATGTDGEERQAMDPQALAELVGIVAAADLSNVMRRQAICAMGPDDTPKPVLREIYISIPDLRDAVLPHHDIASNRWLFQYLTQALDKRMLAMLRRNDDQAIAHSYSLNLNVSTLLSPEFAAFDQSLRAGARGSIVIELQKIDIFADLGAFLFARDFVKDRGYRLCLDGLSGMTLPFIDRERLGVDLVKLFWSPDLVDTHRPDRTNEFHAALERVGKSRVILARCDSEEAVRFGLSSGLRLFQGRHVDRLHSAPTTKATVLRGAKLLAGAAQR